MPQLISLIASSYPRPAPVKWKRKNFCVIHFLLLRTPKNCKKLNKYLQMMTPFDVMSLTHWKEDKHYFIKGLIFVRLQDHILSNISDPGCEAYNWSNFRRTFLPLSQRSHKRSHKSNSLTFGGFFSSALFAKYCYCIEILLWQRKCA